MSKIQLSFPIFKDEIYRLHYWESWYPPPVTVIVTIAAVDLFLLCSVLPIYIILILLPP